VAGLGCSRPLDQRPEYRLAREESRSRGWAWSIARSLKPWGDSQTEIGRGPGPGSSLADPLWAGSVRGHFTVTRSGAALIRLPGEPGRPTRPGDRFFHRTRALSHQAGPPSPAGFVSGGSRASSQSDSPEPLPRLGRSAPSEGVPSGRRISTASVEARGGCRQALASGRRPVATALRASRSRPRQPLEAGMILCRVRDGVSVPHAPGRRTCEAAGRVCRRGAGSFPTPSSASSARWSAYSRLAGGGRRRGKLLPIVRIACLVISQPPR